MNILPDDELYLNRPVFCVGTRRRRRHSTAERICILIKMNENLRRSTAQLGEPAANGTLLHNAHTTYQVRNNLKVGATEYMARSLVYCHRAPFK